MQFRDRKQMLFIKDSYEDGIDVVLDSEAFIFELRT